MSDICEWFTQYIDLAEDVVIVKFSDGTTKTVKRGIYLKEVEDNIRKMLIDQVDRPTGRWIPVSERLPKGYQRILVTKEMFHWANEPVEYTVDIKYFGGNVDFVAWMPLPDPYKAETE